MEDFCKLIVLAFLTTGGSSFPELHNFESHYGGEVIANEDVVFDREEKYALIIINPLSEQIARTYNLHDFNTSYTAIKNVENRKCNIFRTRHTLSDMMDNYESIKRNGFYDITQTFICTSNETIPDSQTSRFGARIADFCKDDEVVFSERKFLSKKKRSIRPMSVAAMNCGFCIGNCNSRPTEPSRDLQENLK